MRDFLKDNNFRETNLVCDYPNSYFPFPPHSNEAIWNLKCSHYCIKNSDLNIFIFNFGGPRDGVATELTYAINNNCPFLIFIEKKNQKTRAFSTLIKANLIKIGKNYNEFPENDDCFLCDIIFSRVCDFFI